MSDGAHKMMVIDVLVFYVIALYLFKIQMTDTLTTITHRNNTRGILHTELFYPVLVVLIRNVSLDFAVFLQ